MKRKLVGLKRYIYEFKTQKELNVFREKNEYKATFVEIFISNGFALEVRFLS